MKTVTLPIEEYEELMQDRKDKHRLMQELEADAKDRGFFVQQMNHFCQRKDPYGYDYGYDMIIEKSTLKIIAKDKVLADAQKEIDRLEKTCEELTEKNCALKQELRDLRGRGFLARVFNKEG